jgi:integrase
MMADDKRSVRVAFKGGLAGRLFKVNGSDRWYLSYWHAGHEYRETTGTADFDTARTKLKKKLEEMASVRRGAELFVAPQTKRVTVAELLDALETDLELRGAKALAHARAHMRAVRNAFGPWRAAELTPEAVDLQIERWREAVVADATINRRVQLLGQAFRFGNQRRRVTTVPTFRRLPETKARQGFFARGTFDLVVNALPAYLRDVARFAYVTGWRRGEILGLTAANVDIALGELRIGDSKNGDGRVIPLLDENGRPNAVGEIVERRLAARVLGDRIVPWLFHHNGKPIADFRKAWAAACTAAGVPDALFHDLRRTFCHDAAEAGTDYGNIMAWTGHKTTATFLRYRIRSLAGMRRAAERVAGFRNGQAPTASVLPIKAAESRS